MENSTSHSNITNIPARAGIGLRAPHYQELWQTRPDIGWLEVHSENYFGAGGSPLAWLERLRREYPLSLHGVGLSLGSTDPLDRDHLTKLKSLIGRFVPGLVSEHLCWSSAGGQHMNDLLPLPYTEEALDHIAARIACVQEYLGREILIENPSSYLRYRHSTIPEWEFLAAVAARADCGILLDVNNIHVSARNLDFDPWRYLEAVPRERVREIHLAGFTVKQHPEGEILIDTHNTRVAEPVWQLYRAALRRLGPLPTLIEWDTDLPALSVLLEEAQIADAAREEIHAVAA